MKGDKIHTGKFYNNTWSKHRAPSKGKWIELFINTQIDKEIFDWFLLVGEINWENTDEKGGDFNFDFWQQAIKNIWQRLMLW